MAMTTEKAADALRDDVDKLKADIAALSETLGKYANATGQDAMRGVRHAREAAQARAQETVHTVEQQITAHPLPSLLVAFGVGLLIGKLMDRR